MKRVGISPNVAHFYGSRSLSCVRCRLATGGRAVHDGANCMCLPAAAAVLAHRARKSGAQLEHHF